MKHQYLKEDLFQAKLHLACIDDLEGLIKKNRKAGNIAKAKLRTVDMLNSLHELEKLQDKKKSFGRKIAIEAIQLGFQN